MYFSYIKYLLSDYILGGIYPLNGSLKFESEFKKFNNFYLISIL